MLMQPRCFLLALLLVVAGCGGGGGDAGGEGASPATSLPPTTTSTTSTTSTTVVTTTSTTVEVVDPYTVPEDPADIDEAYVEAVINEHNRVIGDALRIQLEGGDPAEIVARYNAIYVPEVADFELNQLFNMPAESVARLRTPPGDGATDVTALLEVTSVCIVAEVVQSANDLVVDPPPAFEAELVLRRVEGEAPSLNRTLWKTGSLTGRTQEGSSCDG